LSRTGAPTLICVVPSLMTASLSTVPTSQEEDAGEHNLDQ
jgi:hypothetical protein